MILLTLQNVNKSFGMNEVLKDVNDDIKNVFKLTGFISIFDFEGA